MGTLYQLTKCGYFSSVCLWGLYDFSILSPLSFQDVVTVNHCWFQVVGLLFGPPFNKSSGKLCDFLPIYQTSNDVFFICSISLNTMTLQVESAHVYTSQGVPVSVTGIAQVKTLSIDNFVDFVKSWDVYLSGTWKPATKWRQVSYTRYRRLGPLPIDRRPGTQVEQPLLAWPETKVGVGDACYHHLHDNYKNYPYCFIFYCCDYYNEHRRDDDHCCNSNHYH